MKIETRKLDDLIPYARNARTHSEAQVAQIAASLHEFGWMNPVLVDGQNTIIAGHGRVLAARKLRDARSAIARWKDLDLVPVVQHDALTDAQRRAFIIADNKLALNAGWDIDMLGTELTELRASGVDMDLLGFDASELKSMFALDDETPPRDNVTVGGDRFLLQIECDSEEQLQRLFHEMQEERGLPCKILT